MATSGLLGNKFGLGNKKKTYAWMNGGTNTPKAPSSHTPTPTTVNPGSLVHLSGSKSNGSPPIAGAKGKQFGDWDEEKDPGIQARDILLVLETDSKATRALLKGYNVVGS